MLQRFLFIEPAIFPVSPHAIAPNKRPQISTRCSLEQPAKADQSPNPAQANTTRLAAPPNLPPHSTIIWRAEIPFSNGHDRLPHILHRSFPNCFPSISAAKRVIRRGELFNKSSDKWHRATVLDRPHGGDLIARTARTEMASVRSRFSKKQPPLALQPDFVKFIDPKGHFAVVVKPPGVEIGKEFREATFFAVGDTIRRDETLTRQVGPVLRRPVAVHRLDKVTGGLVIVALTEKAVRSLSSQFQRREVSKTYRARVEGHLASREKLISEPVDGKKAETIVSVVHRRGEWTEVLLSPKSGRKHQLRIHMQQLGHPILFDTMYGASNEHPVLGSCSICLWAEKIAFRHPDDGVPVEVVAEPLSSMFLDDI